MGRIVLYCISFDLKFDVLTSEKLRPDGLALAFQNASQAKAVMKPSFWPSSAWPIWAWLGLAHSLRPGQAQP